MDNYLAPLIGGILIAISTTIMLAFLGRITGISGILGTSLTKYTPDNLWKITFLIGLVLGGVLCQQVKPELFDYKLQAGSFKLIIAGLLVGYGTRLGSGCTSGHGVCGLPRLSKRSIVATVVFMASGIITVFIEGKL